MHPHKPCRLARSTIGRHRRSDRRTPSTQRWPRRWFRSRCSGTRLHSTSKSMGHNRVHRSSMMPATLNATQRAKTCGEQVAHPTCHRAVGSDHLPRLVRAAAMQLQLPAPRAMAICDQAAVAIHTLCRQPAVQPDIQNFPYGSVSRTLSQGSFGLRRPFDGATSTVCLGLEVLGVGTNVAVSCPKTRLARVVSTTR